MGRVLAAHLYSSRSPGSNSIMQFPYSGLLIALLLWLLSEQQNIMRLILIIQTIITKELCITKYF